jgi:hypothetical protein
LVAVPLTLRLDDQGLEMSFVATLAPIGEELVSTHFRWEPAEQIAAWEEALALPAGSLDSLNVMLEASPSHWSGYIALTLGDDEQGYSSCQLGSF